MHEPHTCDIERMVRFQTTREGNFYKISWSTIVIARVSRCLLRRSHKRCTLPKVVSRWGFLEVRWILPGIKRAIPWEIRCSNAVLPLTYVSRTSGTLWIAVHFKFFTPGKMCFVTFLFLRMKFEKVCAIIVILINE